MLDKIKQELETKSFCLVPNFLSQIQLKAINDFFDLHLREFGPAKVGKGEKQRNEAIRGDFTFWLDPLSPTAEFKEITDFLNHLRDGLNSHFYLGLKQYEYHLAFYPPGTFYKKHLDRFEKDSSRTISFIFYLNQEWKKDDHGELVLYTKQSEVLETIYPMPGSLVCFLSEDFPHEVKAAVRERRSLTGWMHNKIIY